MSVSEILAQLSDYMSGRASERELEAWTVSQLQRVLDSGDGRAIALINHIDAALVELQEGMLDLRAFVRQLESLVREAETHIVQLQIEGAVTSNATNKIGNMDETVDLTIHDGFTHLVDHRMKHQFV